MRVDVAEILEDVYMRGSFTVKTANDEKYAISFLELYCDEDAANAAKNEWGAVVGGTAVGVGAD